MRVRVHRVLVHRRQRVPGVRAVHGGPPPEGQGRSNPTKSNLDNRGKPNAHQRFVTALVSETLRHKAALDTVMTISGLRPTLAQSVHDSHLLYLLLFDLLFGKGIQGGGQVKRLLLAHEPALRKAAEGVEGPTSRVPAAAAFPRYARVNPLKTTVAAAKAALVKGEGKGDSGVVASEADVQVCLLAASHSTATHTPTIPIYSIKTGGPAHP